MTGTITLLLREIDGGIPDAESRLFTCVYNDLKDVARQRLRSQHFGILQPTVLVNAAYARLCEKESFSAKDRKHLFFLLARAMHDVLVEFIRAEQTIKRGANRRRVPMVEVSIDDGNRQVELMDLQTALSDLEHVAPKAAQVIRLRFYGGLTHEEIAEASESTVAIVRRHWEYGKAWLHERLSPFP